jgi:voltage-gated potassium channel Kch
MKRLLRGSWQLAALVIAGAVYLLLGYVGYRDYALARGLQWSLLDKLYLDLQLMVMQSGDLFGPLPWQLEMARFLAPLVPIGTAVRLISLLLRTQLRNLRLLWIRGHVVLSGDNTCGLQLVRSLVSGGRSAVLVAHDPESESATACRESGALVIRGDPFDPAALRKAALRRASDMVAMEDSDSANLEMASRAMSMLAEEGGGGGDSPVIYARISDVPMCTWIWRTGSSTLHRNGLRLRMFNPHLSGARVLLREKPLEPAGIAADDQRAARLIIAGFGRFGEALAVQAARVGQFANGSRVRITAIDANAEERSEVFYGRYPQIDKACDIKFFEGDIGGRDILAMIRELAGDENEVTTVAVSLGAGPSSFSAALSIRAWLRGADARVIARASDSAERSGDFSSAVDCADAASGVEVFDLLRESCNAGAVLRAELDKMAQAIHEHFLSLAAEHPGRMDASTLPWERLPSRLWDSNRQQADHIPVKLRAIGCAIEPLSGGTDATFEFHEGEVEILSKMEHARWLASMYLEDYSYGPERDDVLRTHPFIVPWSDLDDKVRENDRSAVRGIPDVLKRAGFRVVRAHV